MPTTIKADVNYAVEESHCEVVFSFYDEDGTKVTASSIGYTFTDENGTVINSLLDQSVTPALDNSIVLKGDDLQILSGETAKWVERHLLIKAIATTDLGADLPVNDVLIFNVYNTVYIT